ncbi:MAG: sigma-54-dependent Fis family transcriptional regulator [Spirochaetales bacterium]|nr:sigma-54-dependent Fis family transcriptional regulator [Spirochaetales bacterium]
MSEEKKPDFAVCIVDDELAVIKSFGGLLEATGISNIIEINDSRELMNSLAKEDIGVLLLDLTMPHMSGERLMPLIRDEYPDLAIVIITGTVDVGTAVRCMKMGAFDYLVKPVENSKLIATIKRAIEIEELKRENRRLKKHFISQELDHPEAFTDIITRNQRMKQLFIYVESIARTDKPVLITGETGTGKELIARAIHVISRRKDNVFLSANIAAYDENTLTDTLFGHVRGAFTGADSSRKGLVETASRGTLFLDEIGDLNESCQVKLLRLLESGQYYPLGSDMPKQSGARIIVATNKDLKQAFENGGFRKDLFFRLYTHHVHLPPLRERMDDLPFLIDYFVKQSSEELGRDIPVVPSQVFGFLKAYSFPGNIRELKSLILDAMSRIPSDSHTLSPGFFYNTLSLNKSEMNEGEKPAIRFGIELPTIKEAVQQVVDEALKRTGGNQSEAAQLLGISQQALNKRLQKRRKTPPRG